MQFSFGSAFNRITIIAERNCNKETCHQFIAGVTIIFLCSSVLVLVAPSKNVPLFKLNGRVTRNLVLIWRSKKYEKALRSAAISLQALRYTMILPLFDILIILITIKILVHDGFRPKNLDFYVYLYTAVFQTLSDINLLFNKIRLFLLLDGRGARRR